MMITCMTPNFDDSIYVETQDEHRKTTRYHVSVWVGLVNPQNGETTIAPAYLNEKIGKLAIGGDKLVRIEGENSV